MVKALLITLLLLSGGAFAQGGDTEMVFPGLELPDPVDWLASTHTFITANGLHDDIEKIGWAVLFVGFLVGLVRMTYYASEAEWWAVYARLLLGIIVLSNVAPLQKFSQNSWNTAYAWSSNLTGETVEDDLVEGAENVEQLITPLLIVGGTAQMFAVKMASRISAASAQGLAKAAKAGASAGTKRSLSFFVRLIMYAFVPIFGFYAALVYLSGLTVLLAMLLLPLAGAMVIFPGGISWWSRWVGMIISSVVTILVLPIMFNIVISLGMIGPMDVLNNHLAGLSSDLSSSQGIILSPYSAMEQLAAKIKGGIDFRQAALEVTGFSSGITETLSDIPELIMGWLLALIAVAVGMLIGLFMMRNFDKVISGFVGGVTSGMMPSLPSSRSIGGGGGGPKDPSSSSRTLSSSSSGGGGGSSVASPSAGGNRSARGGGGSEAVADSSSSQGDSRASSSRGALGPGA